jgi:hypothetical protein
MDLTLINDIFKENYPNKQIVKKWQKDKVFFTFDCGVILKNLHFFVFDLIDNESKFIFYLPNIRKDQIL